jgi:ABC-type uncharacterized transport system substrate-binding protein
VAHYENRDLVTKHVFNPFDPDDPGGRAYRRQVRQVGAALPVAGHRKEWVEQGALFSYAENIREVGRAAAARYVDKILKGARPADLPIDAYEYPELVINLKTARTLGLRSRPRSFNGRTR